MGTNCLGPFLLTQLLLPLLRRTSAAEKDNRDTVRIVWVSSMINTSVQKGGMLFDEATGGPKVMSGMENYMQSKSGIVLLASEYAKRSEDDGIISVVSCYL